MSQAPPTFDAFDKLGLKPFAEKLERFLVVEHDFVEGSLVVSLNAPFGAGKTTFLSMWKSDLDKRRETGADLPKVVVVNAWENDYCGDPLLSIVDVLIKAADTGEKASEADVNKLREAAKDIGWFLLGLGNSLASHFSGLDPAKAAKLAEEKKEGREPKVPDFVTLYEERTKALGKLKETLKQVFGGETPKVFLFIDELDRCRPDYAISYLETIKHIFDVHGLVFVLAVDSHQLECSAKALFGSDLNFAEYFRKFVQRTVSLPEPTEGSVNALATHYAYIYLERQNKRLSMMPISEHRIKIIVDLIRALKMSPRQVQEMFRIVGHAAVAKDPNGRGKILANFGVGLILMAALKVSNAKIFKRIGEANITLEEVGDFLVKLLGKKAAHRWLCIYVTGIHSDETPEQELARLEPIFLKLGYIKPGEKLDAERDFASYVSGWGDAWHFHQQNRWRFLFETIETATSF